MAADLSRPLMDGRRGWWDHARPDTALLEPVGVRALSGSVGLVLVRSEDGAWRRGLFNAVLMPSAAPPMERAYPLAWQKAWVRARFGDRVGSWTPAALRTGSAIAVQLTLDEVEAQVLAGLSRTTAPAADHFRIELALVASARRSSTGGIVRIRRDRFDPDRQYSRAELAADLGAHPGIEGMLPQDAPSMGVLGEYVLGAGSGLLPPDLPGALASHTVPSAPVEDVWSPNVAVPLPLLVNLSWSWSALWSEGEPPADLVTTLDASPPPLAMVPATLYHGLELDGRPFGRLRVRVRHRNPMRPSEWKETTVSFSVDTPPRARIDTIQPDVAEVAWTWEAALVEEPPDGGWPPPPRRLSGNADEVLDLTPTRFGLQWVACTASLALLDLVDEVQCALTVGDQLLSGTLVKARPRFSWTVDSGPVAWEAIAIRGERRVVLAESDSAAHLTLDLDQLYDRDPQTLQLVPPPGLDPRWLAVLTVTDPSSRQTSVSLRAGQAQVVVPVSRPDRFAASKCTVRITWWDLAPGRTTSPAPVHETVDWTAGPWTVPEPQPVA